MKKNLFILVVLLMFSAISCGDGDSGNTGDTGDSGNTGDTGDSGDKEMDDADSAEEACMNMSIIEPNPDYESYFALNVIAEINAYGLSNEMKEAEYKKFNINIKGQPNTELKDSFVYASLNKSGDSVFIVADGDMGDNETYKNTSLLAVLQIDRLKKMKNDGVSKVDAAPQTQLFKITELPDKILKSCITGYSEMVAGKMEVCFEENENFTAGEFIKLGFNVKMIADPEEVANMLGSGSPEDMCNCFNMETEEEVDCP